MSRDWLISLIKLYCILDRKEYIIIVCPLKISISRKLNFYLLKTHSYLGQDPKSVICAFFKQGQCGKGDKCKFSHDLTIERKDIKRSIYVDMRDDEEETMENWNDEKLQEVVLKKHSAEKRMPTTEIVSILNMKLS